MEIFKFGVVTSFDLLPPGAGFYIDGRQSSHFGFKLSSSSVTGAVILYPPDAHDGVPIFWDNTVVTNEKIIHVSRAKIFPTRNFSKIDFRLGWNFRHGALYQTSTALLLGVKNGSGVTAFVDVEKGQILSPNSGDVVTFLEWSVILQGPDKHEELFTYECPKK